MKRLWVVLLLVLGLLAPAPPSHAQSPALVAREIAAIIKGNAVISEAVVKTLMADQTMPHTQASLDVVLGGQDADGDTITYSAQIDSESPAYTWDQQLGLQADNTLLANNYYFNHRGVGEKYIRSTTGLFGCSTRIPISGVAEDS